MSGTRREVATRSSEQQAGRVEAGQARESEKAGMIFCPQIHSNIQTTLNSLHPGFTIVFFYNTRTKMMPFARSSLEVKRLSPKAKLPTRGSAFAAGYDLYA